MHIYTHVHVYVFAGLTLVKAPHLARSYYHLFPLPAFTESTCERSVASTNHSVCVCVGFGVYKVKGEHTHNHNGVWAALVNVTAYDYPGVSANQPKCHCNQCISVLKLMCVTCIYTT